MNYWACVAVWKATVRIAAAICLEAHSLSLGRVLAVDCVIVLDTCEIICQLIRGSVNLTSNTTRLA